MLVGPTVGAGDQDDQEPVKAPEGARVLSGGKDQSGWETLAHKDPEWKVEGGYLEVVPRKGRVIRALNRVTVIDNGKFDKMTGGALEDKPGTLGPVRLQDPGWPVRYRNVWLKPPTDE